MEEKSILERIVVKAKKKNIFPTTYQRAEKGFHGLDINLRNPKDILNALRFLDNYTFEYPCIYHIRWNYDRLSILKEFLIP